MRLDLDIARAAELLPLDTVGASIGLGPHLLEPYGRHVAKISLDAVEERGPLVGDERGAARPGGEHVVGQGPIDTGFDKYPVAPASRMRSSSPLPA